MRYLFALLSIGLVFSACKKEEDIKDPVPKISLVSIYPTQVIQQTDSIVIRFNYKDGDGDLGENVAGKKNLFVTDTRIAVTDSFRIQQLAPSIVNSPITGILRVVIPSTIITSDTSEFETVTYSIRVVDRAGHYSNTMLTPSVTVIR